MGRIAWLDLTVRGGQERRSRTVDAIVAAGGPRYAWFDVPPEDGASGGVPGGNIRNAFLYDPDRVQLSSHRSLTADVLDEAGVADPQAFTGTRQPLEASFQVRGGPGFVTVLNNHFSSRFGSTPVFGAIHPFVQAAETDREAQARALNQYIRSRNQAARAG